MKFTAFRRALSRDEAELAFNNMVSQAKRFAFAERPVITPLPPATGHIIGYSGMAEFNLEGDKFLELNCRLVKEAREHGYATEACKAMLDLWEDTCGGELFARIDSENHDAIKVVRKLGFEMSRPLPVDGPRIYKLYRLYRAEVGEAERSRSS
jgi:RimJ/RimL family protein N-acetyltransferase